MHLCRLIDRSISVIYRSLFQLTYPCNLNVLRVSRCARFTLRASKIEKFSGGACPPDPPKWLRTMPTPTFTHHTSASYKINPWLRHCCTLIYCSFTGKFPARWSFLSVPPKPKVTRVMTTSSIAERQPKVTLI